MKKDKELVKKNKSGLFEMKFVKKAKTFENFLSAVNSLSTPGTMKNTPAKDSVTMKATGKQELSTKGK